MFLAACPSVRIDSAARVQDIRLGLVGLGFRAQRIGAQHKNARNLNIFQQIAPDLLFRTTGFYDRGNVDVNLDELD